jgi:hypothetical protein
MSGRPECSPPPFSGQQDFICFIYVSFMEDKDLIEKNL